MRISIRWKLILFICGPLIVINAALLAWDYARQEAAAIDQTEELISDKARTSADQIAARLEAISQLADSTAAGLTAHGVPAEQQLRTTLVSMLRQNPLVVASAILAEPASGESERVGGATHRAAGGPRQITVSEFLPAGRGDPEWYQSARRLNHGVWSASFTNTTLARGTLYAYVAPFYSGDRFRGVVALLMRSEDVQSILGLGTRPNLSLTARGARNTNAGRGRGAQTTTRPATNPSTQSAPSSNASEPVEGPDARAVRDAQTLQNWSLSSQFGPEGFFVVDREQRLVSHPDVTRIGTPFFPNLGQARDSGSLRQAWAAMLEEGHGAVPVRYLADAIPDVYPDAAHWIAYAHIAGPGWIFATFIPQSLVTQPIVEQLRHRVTLLAVGVLIVALVIMLVSIRMSRPIEALAKAMADLAGGNLKARAVGVTSRDELGTLATGFNQMVEKLEAQVAALAHETAAREGIERELRIARQIQKDLLPEPLPDSGNGAAFDLYAVNVPARRVAGDFYDFFYVGERLFLVIADVSGKGMPAALLMAVTRTLVRNYARLGLSPAEIAAHANQNLIDDAPDSMFVTLFLARYEPQTGHLEYVCAGHPPPLVLKGDGLSHLGPPTGPLLGVFDAKRDGGRIDQAEASLAAGQTLFMYTDGVTDARSPNGKTVGEAGLIRALAKAGSLNARALCEKLFASLQAFEHGSQADDITIMALRRPA